jgi:glycerol uptake facilitator-like aquaporin
MTTSGKPYAAELIGTFILATAVGASGQTGIPAPLVAGLTLLTLVYVLGPVSGAHVNPAVTLGLLSVKAIKAKEAALYILSQLVGGALAMLALSTWYSLPMPSAPIADGSVGELLGALILALGVTTVVLKKVPAEMSGVAVGLSLFTGASVASMASPGVINPAVALGLGAWELTAPAVTVFVLMPIVGGVLGAQISKWLQK